VAAGELQVELPESSSLTVIVLRNRDDRLVLYTGSGRGYLLPSERWVPFLRALAYVNALTVAVAFVLVRPSSGWEFVGALAGGVIAGHAIELVVLAFLSRSDDTLSSKEFYDAALAQQSQTLLVGSAVITGLLSAAMFAVALTVRDAPAKATAVGVVFGLVCLLYVHQLRRKRR
jgi:hypothetical protein